MKYTIPFILITFLLAGCSRRDATIQKELTGTWHRDYYHTWQITNVIASDGKCQSQVFGSNNVMVSSSEGSLIAKNGVLIQTMIQKSDTNMQTPQVVQWQIVHLDKHKLVMKFVSNKGDLVKTYERVER